MTETIGIQIVALIGQDLFYQRVYVCPPYPLYLERVAYLMSFDGRGIWEVMRHIVGNVAEYEIEW
jgi:hypothetical protein